MSNQVDTIKNTISDSHSISDLQNIIDFCTNPANKDFLFVEFSPYSRPSDLSFFEGERDVLDFQAAIAILDHLDEFKEPNGSILLTEIQDFLKSNQIFFMSICPKQFIGHHLCPDSVLNDFTKGKFSDTKVKDITVHLTEDGKPRVEINPSHDQSFVSKQGPQIGKVLSNIYSANKHSPPTGVKREEIVTVFSRLLDLSVSSSSSNFVSIIESMYSLASKNKMPNNVIQMENVADGINTETLKFVRDNFDNITKGVIPRNPFSEKTKTIKLLLEQFKEAINTECQARDVKVQESLKRNLSHLSAFVQNNQSKNIEVHNLVAGDDVLNGDEQHNINSSVSEGPSLDDI